MREVGAPLSIEDVDLDGPADDEVRIRVAASGLCHSDYHFMIGDMPHPLPVVLGHEASGVVEAIGANVQGVKKGDHVATCISTFCGECMQCQGGFSYRCDDKPAREARITQGGKPLHQFGQLGGFAEEMLVHSHSVAKLPEGMPLDRAALLGCAVITGVGAATSRINIPFGASVAVVGCGGVGLNVVQGARLAGAGRIIAIDLSPEKLELAIQFGATDTVMGGSDAVESVVELTSGGVAFAFEVIGLAETLRQSVEMLCKGGTAVFLGVPKFGSDISIPGLPFLQKDISIVGSMVGSLAFQHAIPQYASMYLDGVLKLDPLVSKKIALEDINSGYDELAKGKVARSVICFD